MRSLRLGLPPRAGRTSLDIGRPVIIHGYFTASGHIIVISGYSVISDYNVISDHNVISDYSASGFIVNHP